MPSAFVDVNSRRYSHVQGKEIGNFDTRRRNKSENFVLVLQAHEANSEAIPHYLSQGLWALF
jgi:hypothetical protein